ncbi:hypothetical protein N9N67_04150 [Bacteriovoracaceae bacterium]|nr:hypothetical protein [Bacteriovoracaceae bacterium]
MSKKRAVVICPGRGTYGQKELGYLHRNHSDKTEFFSMIDDYRKSKDQPSVFDLDGEKTFSLKKHIPGENSASLIYACSYADFQDIDQDKFDIVAITGNSMGWYIACACAQAIAPNNAIHVINTMGSQMKDGLIGGQLVYPIVDENWVESIEQTELLQKKVLEANQHHGQVYTSIHFGGLMVLGGEEKALKWLLKELPKVQEHFPFKLPGNAAFHTPLLRETSDKAKTELKQDLFSKPQIPMIDGRGKIWQPYSTDLQELWDYTLGHQVHSTYDFTKAMEIAIKEFAPDSLILTGPGMTMGGAIGQSLVKFNTNNISSKLDFKQAQEGDNPYLLAMGDEAQRKFAIK